MTTTIVLKSSGVSGKQPLTTDLSFGEVAINYADGKLFYKTDLGAIDFFNAKPDYGTVKSVSIDPGATGLTFSGGPITTTGTFTVGGTLGIFNGGTGATSAASAINNLLPSQGSANGKVLASLDGSPVWVDINTSQITGGLGFTPVNIGGDTMTGPLVLYANPINAYEAATKEYVDNVATGLNVHLACVAATTTNLSATYNNGSSGIGATLTGSGAFPQIDGVTIQLNQRILVKNQTDEKQNGIYTLASITSGWTLIRASDFDNSFANEVSAGDFTFIQNGVTQKSTQWIMVTSGTIEIGTSDIEWSQFGAAGVYTAGTGISIVDNTINNTGVTSLTAGSNIAISGQTGGITVSFTGTLPVESGGTGATNATAAINNLLPAQEGQSNKFLITDGLNVSWTSSIPVPVASSTVRGGVKIGANIDVTTEGVISVSRNYNDLTNKPTDLSDFTNTAGYIKSDAVTWENLTGTAPSVGIFDNTITGYIKLTDVTWENITGTAPGLSTFTNDSNYITVSSVTWENITGTAPGLSTFTNDANYVISEDLTWNNIQNKPTFATVATSGLLSALLDVVGTPEDKQILAYDSATQKWGPVSLSLVGGTNGQLQYNNNGTPGGVTNVTATSNKVSFGGVNNISIGGGTSGQVLGTDGAGTLSWVDVATQTDNSPLIWTTSGTYRTLTGYKENGTTSPVRVAEFFNNKLRLTLATFTPTLSATISPASPSWDQPITSFAVNAVNPDDITDQYISSVRSITATNGSISALNTFSAGSQSATPAGTVDWTQTFTTDADSFIRSTSTTIAGGSAAGTIAFNFYNGTTTAEYTTSTANISVTWATPTLSATLGSLTGNTFLQSYNSVAYTVTVTGMSSTSNYANSVTAVGGTTSSATASGTFTFTDPIHKNNTATTRTVSVSTTFTRPASVTGTSYTANLSSTTASASATFTYPSLWLFTAATSSPPTVENIVTVTSFVAGVTALGNAVKVFAGNVTNSESTPRAFWFAIRSSASQPTSFKTGPTSSLLSDVSVTSGNTVSLQPTTPPAGYVAEQYTLYGITLQPGTTYVSIS
jgi:hypothetical protein